MVAIILLQSCDFCIPCNSEGTGDGTYIFTTAIPINSQEPIVYRIDIRNQEIKKIATNCSIFSAPSDAGLLAAVRSINSTEYLLTIDSETSKETILEKENQLFSISYPVISPSSKHIAFLGGNGKLFIYNLNDKAIDKISNYASQDIIYSFSNDGKLFAYFEEEGANLVLKIISTDNYDYTILSHTFQNAVFPQTSLQSLNWNKYNDMLSFSLDIAGTNKIIFLKTSGELTELPISKEIGSSSPVISYDEQYVAFSANDGNIWIRTLKSEVPEFTQITNIDKYEKNIYPFWTNNPNELYYINQMDITGSYYYYSLYKAKLLTERNQLKFSETSLLCNNIFNAYWKYFEAK